MLHDTEGFKPSYVSLERYVDCLNTSLHTKNHEKQIYLSSPKVKHTFSDFLKNMFQHNNFSTAVYALSYGRKEELSLSITEKIGTITVKKQIQDIENDEEQSYRDKAIVKIKIKSKFQKLYHKLFPEKDFKVTRTYCEDADGHGLDTKVSDENMPCLDALLNI